MTAFIPPIPPIPPFAPNLNDGRPLRTFKPPEENDLTHTHPIPPLAERRNYNPTYKYGINCDEYIEFTDYVHENFDSISKFLRRLNLASSFDFPKLRQKILEITSMTEAQVDRLKDLEDANFDYYMYTFGGRDVAGRGWTRFEAGNALRKYIREIKSNNPKKQINEMLEKEDEWIKFYQSQTQAQTQADDEMENE